MTNVICLDGSVFFGWDRDNLYITNAVLIFNVIDHRENEG